MSLGDLIKFFTAEVNFYALEYGKFSEVCVFKGHLQHLKL